MSRTEKDRKSEILAGALFDEMIAPLAAQFDEKGRSPFFPMGPDAAAETYFLPPAAAALGKDPSRIKNGGCPQGVIEALVEYWRRTGDDELSDLGPQLEEVAAALKAEGETETGEINPLCYTLF